MVQIYCYNTIDFMIMLGILTMEVLNMNNQDLLMDELNKHFKWNKARLRFVTKFLIALFIVRTINFTKIANKIDGAEKEDSRYKQIQRFFRLYEMDYKQVSSFVANVLPNHDEKWVLSMDRTNWKFGKININILTLGIAYKGTAFPLMWIMLDKQGNSNTEERIELIKSFIDLFGKDKIDCIVADREFIGKCWFKYLIKDAGITFRIRVKEACYINKVNGEKAPLKNFFRDIKIGDQKILSKKRSLWGHSLFITGTKSKEGELVIVVTNHLPETALQDYAKRWEIETLFKCMKSSGFNFEETHLTHLDRINKLMALLTIAFCWTYLTGEWKNESNPIKIKTHGRKAMSVFRLGLNILGEIVTFMHRKITEFREVVKLLSCTWPHIEGQSNKFSGL